MQDHDQDTDDKYLSEIYASLKQEQPSSEQDEKILAAARKEVVTDNAVVTKGDSSLIPKKAAGPFSGRWAVPVSLAAVIVLSVTLVVMIERERPYSLTSMPEPASTEQKTRPLELAQSAEKRQSAKIATKESAQSVDEQSAEARLKKSHELELSSLPQAAPPSASLSPARPRADVSDSEKSAPGVSAGSGQESAPVPLQKGKPKQVPEKELADADVARNITTDSSVSVKREAPAVSAPAADTTKQPETQPSVAEFKDEATTSDSEEASVLTAVAPLAAQDQVASAATTAEDEASTSEEAQTETPPIVARSVSEAAPSESEKSIALAASAASTVPQKQAPDVTVESMAEAAEELGEDQRSALALQSPQERLMPEGEPAAAASMAIAKTKEEQVPAMDAESISAAASPSGVLAKNDRLNSQCRQMGQQACLISPSCMLQQQAGDKSYQCRAAANACETNFSQSLNGKDDCERRPECRYVPADCYCAPGQDCPCTGGAPAMCIPKSVGE